MPKIIIGNKYGLLTVHSFARITPCGHKSYNCICDCGNTVIRTGTSMLRSQNSSCGCFSKRGANHHQWTGIGEISSAFWYEHIVRSANGSKSNRSEKELSLTMKQAWNLFLEQDRKCALSGIELIFPKVSKDKNWTASLDRIDSSKGYVLDNVQWVHKDINIMKNKFDNDYFIHVCKSVAKRVKLAEEIAKEMSQMKPITDVAKDLSDHVDKIVLTKMIEIAKNAGGACEVNI